MVYIYIPFPGGSDCQESAYNSRNLGSVPGSGSQEDPLKKEMAICSSILAWKSHRWRSLAGYRVHRESEMTEQLTHAHTHTHTHTHRWQKVRHNWATNVWSCTQSHTHTYMLLFSLSVMSDSLWPIDCSTPPFSFPHCLPEFAQTHVHWISDAI